MSLEVVKNTSMPASAFKPPSATKEQDYFLLPLDEGADMNFRVAAIRAIKVFAKEIEKSMPGLAKKILADYEKEPEHLQVVLSARGLIRHGQDTYPPLYPSRVVCVDSLSKAMEECHRYINRYDVKPREWTGGTLVEGNTGEIVGRILYDGRTQKPDGSFL